MFKYRRKILCIGNSDARDELYDILADEYEVVAVETNEEAMAILNDGMSSVSVVVVDNGEDGFRFLEMKAENRLLSYIPTLFSTESGRNEEDLRALKSGATDFIIKPYKKEIVKRRLRNYIRLSEGSHMIYDELTGVYTREAFYHYGRNYINIANSQPMDFIMADIRNFKIINDMYSAKVGDELLKQWCRILTGVEPFSKGILGRYMGDMFAMIVPRPIEYTEEMFRRLTAELNKYVSDISLDICFGIYQIHRDIAIPAMCDRAMIALREIKESEQGCYAIYNDELRNKLWHKQKIISEMHDALADGQFCVFLQPKCELKSQKLVGAEALVRWNYPDRGFISPGEFIPIFEQNGFITELDKFVWEQACKILRKWIDEGKQPIPISVNVSRVDIYNIKLVDILCDLMHKYKLDFNLLHLEITETAYTDNPMQLIDTVVKLREKGFLIEMDDFGVGYSSLTMLAEVPVDTIKLDMSFVRKLDNNNSTKIGNILSFIIDLSKWLGLSVVAEGIETVEQLEFLKSICCRYGQGYFFSKPVPVEEFEAIAAVNGKSLFTANEKLRQVGKLFINEIWTPDSRFNIVFSDCPCPLGIIEYSDGKFNLVRANSPCIEMLHPDKDDYPVSSSNLLDIIVEDDREEFIRTISSQLIESDKCFSVASRYIINGGERHIVFKGRVIALSGAGALMIASFVDVDDANNLVSK